MVQVEQRHEAAAIRKAIAALRGRGSPYPDPLRRRIVAYYRARREQGAPMTTIATEVGIIWQTLERWVSSDTPVKLMKSAGFERLEIVDAPAPITDGHFVVRGPGGLCIEGLDIDSLAELIRRLS